MSRKILSIFMTVFVLLSVGISAVFAEETNVPEKSETIIQEYSELSQVDEETSSEELAANGFLEGVTEQFAEQPTTYVEPLDYPSVSVSAISNFFGKANADYNQYTKEFTVTYYLKSQKGVLTTQWSLEYDSKALKLDPKKNAVEHICPVIGDKAVINYEENKISYNATNVDLFDFSKDGTPFVRLIFDVADVSGNQPIITKIDLTIDELWVFDGKTEVPIVNDLRAVGASKLSALNVSKRTSLTESNYVEPTTAVPTTSDEHITPDEAASSVEPTTVSVPATDATSITLPVPTKSDGGNSESNTPGKAQSAPGDEALINTGNPIHAVIMLVVAILATGCLFAMRKKVMLLD